MRRKTMAKGVRMHAFFETSPLRRKVAGVLVEMRAQEKAPHLAVVGIGINVNQSPEDFPPELQSRAISLAMALGRPIDRRQLGVALLRYLDRTYRERFTNDALPKLELLR